MSRDSDGDKWRSRRKLLTPTFHFKILDIFNRVFIEHAKVLASQLSAVADGRVTDIFSYVTLCTLDIICGIGPSLTVSFASTLAFL